MTDFLKRVQHGFEKKGKNGVKYFVIPSFLGAGVEKHCFTTRIGGVSEGAYASLNLSRTRENNPENKEENYRRVCCALDVPYESLTPVSYTHLGDNVLLSPACASWDMFENFEQRGRVFKEIVKGL